MFAQIIDFQAEKIKRETLVTARPVAIGNLTAALANPSLSLDECAAQMQRFESLAKIINSKYVLL